MVGTADCHGWAGVCDGAADLVGVLLHGAFVLTLSLAKGLRVLGGGVDGVVLVELVVGGLEVLW